MATCERCGTAFRRYLGRQNHRFCSATCRYAATLTARRETYRSDPAAVQAKNAKWRQENPERHRFIQRRWHLNNLYGMTPERYDELLEAQGGGCALCGTPPGKAQLQVDHDHGCCPGRQSCGQCIRGLLCLPCNRLLGWYENRTSEIASYLAGRKEVAS